MLGRCTRLTMPTSLNILIVIAIATVSGCSDAPNDEREAWLRGYTSEDAGARAAIQRLSQELQSDTNKSIYRVHWSSASSGPSQAAVLYLRREQLIGYESKPYSVHTSTWTNVDIQTVHTLAAKQGRFEDLRPRDWPPEK